MCLTQLGCFNGASLDSDELVDLVLDAEAVGLHALDLGRFLNGTVTTLGGDQLATNLLDDVDTLFVQLDYMCANVHDTPFNVCGLLPEWIALLGARCRCRETACGVAVVLT